MSSHLKPISEKEKEYAKTIFPSTGYYKKMVKCGAIVVEA